MMMLPLTSVHGLNEHHIMLLREVLQPYADKVEKVALFGSRATGAFKPTSDIDIVLYGSISPTEIARLQLAFSESALPYTVDIVGYSLIDAPALREHIDSCAVDLFRFK